MRSIVLANAVFLALAVVVTVQAPSIFVPPAYAYDCNPHRPTNWLASYLGGAQRSGTWADVKAAIEERIPYVHKDNMGVFNNFSYSWVSLSDSVGDRYVQIGSAADDNNVRWVFEQTETSTGVHDLNWDPINPVGDTTAYKVSRDGASTYGAWWGLNEDVVDASFTQQYASLASETTDQANQFNGTSNNHEGFQTVMVYDASTSSWQNFDGTDKTIPSHSAKLAPYL